MRYPAIKYQIKSKEDITNQIIQKFKSLIDILVIKFSISGKIDQGDKNQVLSHLANVYPREGTDRVYNQNFYFTIAYHKLLYILYRKNKHISFHQPRVQRILNNGRDIYHDSFRDREQKQSLVKFLQGKLLQLNQKFNKGYYLIIIKKLCQFLQNPQDAPYKRRDIIKQIRQNSYKDGKKIPKNYIYRVFYILKKNFIQWKKQYYVSIKPREIYG